MPSGKGWMSASAEPTRLPDLPPAWERLEHAADEAAAAVRFWRRRALDAEQEVARLQRALEELASTIRERPEDLADELRRLRAENAALQSRMLQARKRVQGLLKRLVTLGIEA